MTAVPIWIQTKVEMSGSAKMEVPSFGGEDKTYHGCPRPRRSGPSHCESARFPLGSKSAPPEEGRPVVWSNPSTPRFSQRWCPICGLLATLKIGHFYFGLTTFVRDPLRDTRPPGAGRDRPRDLRGAFVHDDK